MKDELIGTSRGRDRLVMVCPECADSRAPNGGAAMPDEEPMSRLDRFCTRPAAAACAWLACLAVADVRAQSTVRRSPRAVYGPVSEGGSDKAPLAHPEKLIPVEEHARIHWCNHIKPHLEATEEIIASTDSEGTPIGVSSEHLVCLPERFISLPARKLPFLISAAEPTPPQSFDLRRGFVATLEPRQRRTGAADQFSIGVALRLVHGQASAASATVSANRLVTGSSGAEHIRKNTGLRASIGDIPRHPLQKIVGGGFEALAGVRSTSPRTSLRVPASYRGCPSVGLVAALPRCVPGARLSKATASRSRALRFTGAVINGP